MKQLLILSGKGGTGKTTVASAFIKLAEAKLYSDCDVDAPNLHLVSGQNTSPSKKNYFGMPKAKIDTQLCIKCDECRQNCRFGAITIEKDYTIDIFDCEGCGVCEYNCPVDAISLVPVISGELILYSQDDSAFSTAQLKMGSGTSGLLVTEVKKQMRIQKINTDLAVIDGSPGIGCPVIASLTGVDLVLIVAEPSISGINDMTRIIDTSLKLGIKIAVCVNKHDINMENTEKIKSICISEGIPFTGLIPFDSNAIRAINQGKTIVDIDCEAGAWVRKVYDRTISVLNDEFEG